MKNTHKHKKHTPRKLIQIKSSNTIKVQTTNLSRWFVCLDLSFWLGLDLVVADVGYVVVDLLSLCCVCSLIANKKLMHCVVSGEFSNGYSRLKNGVDFWDSKTSPGHVTLTAENSGIQNGGKINVEVEDKCKNEDICC